MKTARCSCVSLTQIVKQVCMHVCLCACVCVCVCVCVCARARARIPFGDTLGLCGGLDLRGLASCEDLAVNPAQAPDPFHLDLDCYRHMYVDDFEVCRQYMNIIYTLVMGVTWYMVHGVCVCTHSFVVLRPWRLKVLFTHRNVFYVSGFSTDTTIAWVVMIHQF